MARGCRTVPYRSILSVLGSYLLLLAFHLPPLSFSHLKKDVGDWTRGLWGQNRLALQSWVATQPCLAAVSQVQNPYFNNSDWRLYWIVAVEI